MENFILLNILTELLSIVLIRLVHRPNARSSVDGTRREGGFFHCEIMTITFPYLRLKDLVNLHDNVSNISSITTVRYEVENRTVSKMLGDRMGSCGQPGQIGG